MRTTLAATLFILAALAAAATAAPKPAPSYQYCGTRGAKACPPKYTCISDPRAGGCGLACDMAGICVSGPRHGDTFCGGFAGIKCVGKNRECYDDPRDDCDPMNGGADCGGICLLKL